MSIQYSWFFKLSYGNYNIKKNVEVLYKAQTANMDSEHDFELTLKYVVRTLFKKISTSANEESGAELVLIVKEATVDRKSLQVLGNFIKKWVGTLR